MYENFNDFEFVIRHPHCFSWWDGHRFISDLQSALTYGTPAEASQVYIDASQHFGYQHSFLKPIIEIKAI